MNGGWIATAEYADAEDPLRGMPARESGTLRPRGCLRRGRGIFGSAAIEDLLTGVFEGLVAGGEAERAAQLIRDYRDHCATASRPVDWCDAMLARLE